MSFEPPIWLFHLEALARRVVQLLQAELTNLIGIRYFTPLACLALLALVIAAFLAVLAIAVLAGAGKSMERRLCPHGIPVSRKQKTFCPTCIREQRALDELHGRQRARARARAVKR